MARTHSYVVDSNSGRNRGTGASCAAMNVIQWLLGMRVARPQDDQEYQQAKAQLAHAQATIEALAYPTEPIKKPRRRGHDYGPH